MNGKMESIRYIDSKGNIKKLETIKRKHDTSKKPLVYYDFGYIAMPVFIGCGIGIFADRHFSSGPTYTIVGLLIGMLLAFYNLYNLVIKKDG